MRQPVIIFKDRPVGIIDIFSGLHEIGRGELTDEHAAVSYGQPVLIWRDQVYGPGDLGLDVLLADDKPPIDHEPTIRDIGSSGLLREWNRLRDAIAR